jgi:hypothetical protein
MQAVQHLNQVLQKSQSGYDASYPDFGQRISRQSCLREIMRDRAYNIECLVKEKQVLVRHDTVFFSQKSC